jgi:hypothetical protein
MRGVTAHTHTTKVEPDVSDKVKSSAEHAKEVAAKRKAQAEAAAEKAEARVREAAAKAKERLDRKAS